MLANQQPMDLPPKCADFTFITEDTPPGLSSAPDFPPESCVVESKLEIVAPQSSVVLRSSLPSLPRLATRR